jgi:hypothetical protein
MLRRCKGRRDAVSKLALNLDSELVRGGLHLRFIFA